MLRLAKPAFITGLAVMLAVFLALSADAQGVANSHLVILVDMSVSFAPLKPEDIRALESIGDAVVKIAVQQQWDPPLGLYWGKIGASSLFADPPCGRAVLYNPRIVQKKEVHELRNQDELRAWFKACIKILTGGAVKLEQYTDISGAVTLAGEIGKHAPGVKAIIILSDFVESLPPGTQPVEIRLSGERAVLVYRPEVSDHKDPNQMFRRLVEWEERLKKAGAKDVCRVPVRGIGPGSIERCVTR